METTILNFRHLLEQHDLDAVLLAEITRHLATRGVETANQPLVGRIGPDRRPRHRSLHATSARAIRGAGCSELFLGGRTADAPPELTSHRSSTAPIHEI